MTSVRTILHVDMDAFFAAVEQLDNPQLRDKPILIGSDRPRGVVSTASYEARPFGCHSAQPMAVAKRLCPQAIVVPPRYSRYREISQRMFRIFEQFTPQIEPLSIDEAFLDVTASQRIHGDGPTIAEKLRQRVRDELNLTASVGVAPNKFLAKLASDIHKPDGLTVVTADMLDTWLARLPVGKIWGIGPKSAAKLHDMNIRTIGDLRKQSADWMRHRFGADADRYMNLCRGIDDRPVVSDAEAKSISAEQTFEVDLVWPDEVRRILLGEVEEVAYRVRQHNLKARTVTLKIRYGDFKTITRSTTLKEPADRTDDFYRAARELFDTWAEKGFQPVRLIGMAAKDFSQGSEQMQLFADPRNEKLTRLDRVLDQINDRFGKSAVRRGGSGT